MNEEVMALVKQIIDQNTLILVTNQQLLEILAAPPTFYVPEKKAEGD